MKEKKQKLFLLYGNIPLKFNYYYKYAFHFNGIAEDGVKIIGIVTGTADNLYDFEFSNNEKITLNNFEFSNIKFYTKNNELISEIENDIW